jgi:DNA-binding YbaB/EbfC family protein
MKEKVTMMNKFLFRQAQELQTKIAKAQEELKDVTIEVSTGGGAIKVVIDGQQEVHSISISPEVVNADDIGMLEDLVMTAMNEAIRKSQELTASRLGGIAGGLKLPGMP